MRGNDVILRKFIEIVYKNNLYIFINVYSLIIEFLQFHTKSRLTIIKTNHRKRN